MTPAPRRPSPSSPATDPGPSPQRPAAGPQSPAALTRAEALRWWRAGYDAGRQAAEHEHQASARWERLAASFRAQRAADQQARLDALLLETIAALASLFSKNNPSSTPP